MPRRAARPASSIAERMSADITQLLDLAEKWPALISATKRQSPSIDSAKVLNQLSVEVGVPQNELRRVFNCLDNLRIMEEDAGNVDSAIERISQLVAPDVANRIKENVEFLKEAVNSYGRDNPVYITTKAQRLTYARERLFSQAEIITDARPIFNSTGEEIIEFVITHSFVLTSVVDNEVHREFYSIDNADLLNLRKACDRALVKARTLKIALEAKWPTEVLNDDPR